MTWTMTQLSWIWPILAVLALVLISAGIVLFSRWFSNRLDRDARARRQQSVLDIARERFARGEITRQDFEALTRRVQP